MKTNCSHKDNLIMRKRFVGSNHKTKIAEAILKEKAHSVALLSDVVICSVMCLKIPLKGKTWHA